MDNDDSWASTESITGNTWGLVAFHCSWNLGTKPSKAKALNQPFKTNIQATLVASLGPSIYKRKPLAPSFSYKLTESKSRARWFQWTKCAIKYKHF